MSTFIGQVMAFSLVNCHSEMTSLPSDVQVVELSVEESTDHTGCGDGKSAVSLDGDVGLDKNLLTKCCPDNECRIGTFSPVMLTSSLFILDPLITQSPDDYSGLQYRQISTSLFRPPIAR